MEKGLFDILLGVLDLNFLDSNVSVKVVTGRVYSTVRSLSKLNPIVLVTEHVFKLT